MKVMLFVVLVVLALGSFGVEVPALPPSEFVDTEVSTNFTFTVGEGSNRRLVFTVEFEASPTNPKKSLRPVDREAGKMVEFRNS